MFILQKIRDDFNARQDRWEHARDKFIEKASYYPEGNYEERHPSPAMRLKFLRDALIWGAIIAVAVFLLIGFVIKEVKEDNNNKPKKEEVVQQDNKDKSCQDFNKNDFVRIHYGEYRCNW